MIPPATLGFSTVYRCQSEAKNGKRWWTRGNELDQPVRQTLMLFKNVLLLLLLLLLFPWYNYKEEVVSDEEVGPHHQLVKSWALKRSRLLRKNAGARGNGASWKIRSWPTGSQSRESPSDILHFVCFQKESIESWKRKRNFHFSLSPYFFGCQSCWITFQRIVIIKLDGNMSSCSNANSTLMLVVTIPDFLIWTRADTPETSTRKK